MRADLKDVIVNTGRRKSDYKRKPLRNLNEEQIEALPYREGIRPKSIYRDLTDRLKPLYGFLKKNAGRPWNDVFSEICEHADPRNIRGKHLRDHVRLLVIGSGGREDFLWWHWRHIAFYVDEKGILRYNGERKRYKYKPELNPDRCQIGDNFYERTNGCWFQIWYEKVERRHKVWNYLLNRYEIEYYLDEVRVRQKQLSKKELRRLGLSNNPNSNWWEKS